MRTLTIDRDEMATGFITPPENGGQIVEVSYARYDDVILKRVHDHSDRSEEITAYRVPVRGEFEPQNGTPKLGRKIGPATIQ